MKHKNSFYSNCMKKLSPRIKKNTYIGFDVETYGKENKFYSGGLYWYDRGKERFEYFLDKEKMAEFMLTRKFRNKFIIATNLNFDFSVVFYETKYWNKFKILMRDGNIIQASFDLGNNNGKIRFIDTSNYAFMSVKKLGEIIGIHKFKSPSFLGKKPQNDDERLELMNYNRQDCKVTHDFIMFFQEGINTVKGTVKLTIASTSLHTWRMNYQPMNLIKEQYLLKDKDVKDFIFSGYYGGRTEVFKRGTFHNVDYYDVNSLYPFVMCMKFPLPNSVKSVKRPSINNILTYEGVSTCEVEIYDIDKPLLPFRYNEKLCFPTGKFKGTWNNCELREALNLGYSIKPIKQIIYTESFEPFKEFIENMYSLRRKYQLENSAFEFIVKILMNSLYGKFGTKKVEDYKIIDLLHFEGGYEEFIKSVGNIDFDVKDSKVIIKKYKKFNGIYSFPILASYVTSLARLHMYEFIKDKNVIYTDTDSIVTGNTLDNTGTALGQMKHECHVEKGIFIKPKFYMLNDSIKIKGINKANLEDFEVILAGGTVSKMKFSRLKESVRRGMKPNMIMTVDKRLGLEDNKRIWEHQDLTRISESVPIEVNI